MTVFLYETIIATLGENSTKGLTSDTDLFEFGVDSLQATRVRNVISKSLEMGNITLGQNVVYEHPSVSKLADFLLDLNSGKLGVQDQASVSREMLELVDKWSAKLVRPSASVDSIQAKNDGVVGEVVVLTGATGSLGAHILDNLVRRPEVARVICLSRASSHAESFARVTSSLIQRQRYLSPEAMNKIISFASDVTRPDLGLEPEQLEMIRLQSTGYIHNAWPVNFVLSLSSFEPHIGGAINLMNLALSSPNKRKPAFFFSSSVGTRQGRLDRVAEEDFPDDPITAGRMGYGRSKWVVEKLCERARHLGAKVGVLRIGQLVGDTEQ